MINIDLSDITAFVTTAELGSLSAAALHLNHLQSNITVKIKKIENYYNTQLFTRKSKGVELTSKGKIIYKNYKTILKIWKETDEAIASQGNILRFGINSTMRGNQFANIIKELTLNYPDLSLTFRTGTTNNLEQQINASELDIAFIFGTAKDKNLDYLKNGEEELVLVGKDLSHQFSQILNKNKVLCLAEDCCYMTILDELYQQYHVPLSEKIYISDLEDLICFSQLGLGIALVAKSLVSKYKIQHYIEIPPNYRNMAGYIISRKNHIFTAIEKDFISISQHIKLI